jgi:hypothetical protein
VSFFVYTFGWNSGQGKYYKFDVGHTKTQATLIPIHTN